MKRSGLTYADAQRMGKGTLKLALPRWSVEVTRWRQVSGSVLDRVFYALKKQHGEQVTLDLAEREAEDLAIACERDGKARTAEAIRAAVRLAKAKKEDDGGKAAMKEAFRIAFAAGELEPDEIEAGKRKGLL